MHEPTKTTDLVQTQNEYGGVKHVCVTVQHKNKPSKLFNKISSDRYNAEKHLTKMLKLCFQLVDLGSR